MTTVGEEQKKIPSETTEQKTVFSELSETTPVPTEEHENAVSASELPGTPSDGRNKVDINVESYSEEELKITPAEKVAFIDSMITGDRYREKFSIFGGRISITLRSRTTDETRALYAYIRHALQKGDNGLEIADGDMTYVPLVAQVEELNGTSFPEMKKPYAYTETDGKTIEPGWLEDFKAWKAKPEGLTSAIINRIQLFEYKYWTMVKEAANQNFWKTDTSTAE